MPYRKNSYIKKKGHRMRRYSRIAKDWWDFTTLDKELLKEASELHNRSFRIYKLLEKINKKRTFRHMWTDWSGSPVAKGSRYYQ